jgi:hypothetical protein
MKIMRIILIVVLVSTSISNIAFAAKGVVVFKKSGCDYFIVQTTMGYGILEWYGGNDPDEDDVLVGNFESYGMMDIYNLSADSELTVWVEDYWLSKSRALEEYYDKCH